MSKKNQRETDPSTTSKPQKRRRRSIFQILHPTKSEPPSTQKTNRKHRRSSSTKSQFEKLKSIISSLFPKKSVRIKPPKSTKTRARKQRSRSFSFRRKKKKKQKNVNRSKSNHSSSKDSKHKRTTSCHVNFPSTMDYISENEECPEIQTMKSNTILLPSNSVFLEDIIEEENDIGSTSDTEEYKDPNEYLPRDKLPLAPRSSSFMRQFEKRPEYITYYPPASLMDAFNTITVDDQERSVTVEMKSGTKQRISAVDQLFELASMTLDYSNFYGYEDVAIENNDEFEDVPIENNDEFEDVVIDNNDEYELNESSEQVDGSILSSFTEDNEYNETLSWQ